MMNWTKEIRIQKWFPFEVNPSSGPADVQCRRLLFLVIGLGLCARLVRYYLCFPLWDDESFLCVNLIDRSFQDLLQPLDYHQVAPILFLWIERLAVKTLGFSEYSLRFMPFVCSIASLFLFSLVARRLFNGTSYSFAVAVFAVSYPGIRYAAEAKPYGSDTFASLLVLALVVEWSCRRNWHLLLALAALTPIILGLSYPAVFTVGGLSLTVAMILLQRKGTKKEWIALSIWFASTLLSFAFWFLTVGRVQSGAEAEFMGDYWKSSFPPVTEPWKLPFWLVKTHASDFLAYPLGGPNWASSVTFILCLLGTVHLVRQKQWFCISLLLGPAGLHLMAAALHKYPYGGHVKFSQYLAPMICCFIGAGGALVVEWSSRWKFRRMVPVWRGTAWGCAILFAIGLMSVFRDLANPYKTRSDFRARAFAQSFWPGAHSAEEVLCLKDDLGVDVVPDQHTELSWSAHYRCNRAIEISRCSLKPADFERVSMNRPLRCVLYRDARYKIDHERLKQWLSEMESRYELIAHESLPFARLAKDDRRLLTMEYIDSYKFVPRDPLANGSHLRYQSLNNP